VGFYAEWGGLRGNTHNQVQCGECGLEISAVWSLVLKKIEQKKYEMERGAAKADQMGAGLVFPGFPCHGSGGSVRGSGWEGPEGTMISSNACMVATPKQCSRARTFDFFLCGWELEKLFRLSGGSHPRRRSPEN
jgi:hypothetical protein